MRVVFIIRFLSNVILSLMSLAILSVRVASHFRFGGAPGGWVSNLTSTLMVLGMHTPAFCFLYFSPILLTEVPRKWISFP